MSTRCVIQVEGETARIYKHSDGYPEGVTPFLVPFVDKFVETRGGNDPQYFLAQLLRRWALQEKEDGTFYDNFLGWGVMTEDPGDIEFKYLVDLSAPKGKRVRIIRV